MTLEEEATKLRVELARLGAAHGRRYPSGMKELILGWVDRAREQGMNVTEAIRRLGVSQNQLSNWRAASRAAKQHALVRVNVVDDVRGSPLAVVSPAGFRVEGVTIAQAIELLRALS